MMLECFYVTSRTRLVFLSVFTNYGLFIGCMLTLVQLVNLMLIRFKNIDVGISSTMFVLCLIFCMITSWWLRDFFLSVCNKSMLFARILISAVFFSIGIYYFRSLPESLNVIRDFVLCVAFFQISATHISTILIYGILSIGSFCKPAIRFNDVIRFVNQSRTRLPYIFIKPSNKKASIVSFILGVSLLFVSHHIPQKHTILSEILVPVCWTFGLMVIFTALSYLQPTASYLQTIDTRAPILYLRSFSDERFFPSFLRQGFDFSIKTRLSGYFSLYGPFIAVASTVLNSSIGAGSAKEYLSDEKWKDFVLNKIRESQFTLLSIGTTPGIDWKLKSILKNDRAESTLMTFLYTRKNLIKLAFGRKQFREDMNERFEILRANLAGTIWADTISTLPDVHTVRAIVLQDNGCIRVIRSNSRGKTAFQVSCIIGHYIHLRKLLLSTNSD